MICEKCGVLKRVLYFSYLRNNQLLKNNNYKNIVCLQLDKCMNMDSKKQLYIISGCNGAGKTTASYTVLPDVLECKEFVNADEIARGLSPFNPESMAIEAGRLMLQRINELLRNQQNFSIETTLATRSYTRLVHRAQEQGYKVNLIYFWLSSPDLAIQRVAQRVRNGGHDIPKEVVLRRYQAGIDNFFNIYMPCVDYWLLAKHPVMFSLKVDEE